MDIKPLYEKPVVMIFDIQRRVIEVEAIDQKYNSVHGVYSKNPLGRNLEGASGLLH